MNVHLICSEAIRNIVEEQLSGKNIRIDPRAEVIIVEKGYQTSNDKVNILFDPSTLDNLINFISKLPDEYADRQMMAGRNKDGYKLFSIEEVLFIEGSGNHTYCYLISGESYYLKEKIYQLEENLGKRIFVRVGKPYLVNMLNVSEIIPSSGGKFLLKFKNSGLQVDVSRSYSKSFKEYIGINQRRFLR